MAPSLAEGLVKMEVLYPLFIIVKDELRVDIVTTPKDLNCYERIDIEEGLYAGWDKKGYPIKISWQHKVGPKVEITQEISQVDKLRETILTYAKCTRPKVPFVYSCSQDNIVELFKAAEEHIKAGRKSFKNH